MFEYIKRNINQGFFKNRNLIFGVRNRIFV